ncbi:hypothetical protein HG530_011810 [Fusarium avenaceum]|nr:hypothetical protein HG530_011810 [Fusarium avenaceum]
MQFSTITLFLAATMGVVATPVDSSAQELDARGNLFPRLDYHGSLLNVFKLFCNCGKRDSAMLLKASLAAYSKI